MCKCDQKKAILDGIEFWVRKIIYKDTCIKEHGFEVGARYVLVYLSYVIRMSLLCHSYVLVCHPYVIRMSLVCTCMSFVYTRMSPVCHLYALYLFIYLFIYIYLFVYIYL